MEYLDVELRSAPDRALALLAPAGDCERLARRQSVETAIRSDANRSRLGGVATMVACATLLAVCP